MAIKNKDIAQRVRELRELSDMTTAELAEVAGIPESVYIDYETGDGDISASSLYEIARHLGVDLSLLLTGATPKMNVFTVTRHGKGVNVNRRSQYEYQALAANFSGKTVEPFVITVPTSQRDAQIALNSHPGQEMSYVLEGTLKVVIHGNEIILNPGDSIYFDSTQPHGMATVGDVPAKFLAIIM